MTRQMHRQKHPRESETFWMADEHGDLKLWRCVRVELPRGADYSVIHYQAA